MVQCLIKHRNIFTYTLVNLKKHEAMTYVKLSLGLAEEKDEI